jgi:DNA-binding GntR family transcriptional regulator
LARQFQVSLAAVREALSRLVADGLVVASDQKGFRVSPLSLRDLQDVTETRIELECLALRRSIARGDAQWESNLRSAWSELCAAPYAAPGERPDQYEIWCTAHSRFHLALVAGCGLGWLLRFRTVLFEQSERYRRLGSAADPAPRDDTGEHGRIFAATIDRDADSAARELASHFRATATRVLHVLSDGLPQ